MKYVKQPDPYSCGPTAIINALKWAGEEVSSQQLLPFLQFGCRTIDLENPHDYDSNGTTDADFDRVLRYVGKGVFKVKRKKHPTLPEMKRHLQAGGAICFSYHWEEDGQVGDHFCFFAGLKRGCFVVANDHTARIEKTISLRTIKTIRKWMKKGEEYPYAWFLTLQD